MSDSFWVPEEPKPKVLRHVGFLSGFWNGVARFVGIGAVTPNTREYHATDNPEGWRRHQLATCGWVDDVLKELAQAIERGNVLADENRKLNLALYHLMREATEADPLDGPTITTVGSADELV